MDDFHLVSSAIWFSPSLSVPFVADCLFGVSGFGASRPSLASHWIQNPIEIGEWTSVINDKRCSLACVHRIDESHTGFMQNRGTITFLAGKVADHAHWEGGIGGRRNGVGETSPGIDHIAMWDHRNRRHLNLWDGVGVLLLLRKCPWLGLALAVPCSAGILLCESKAVENRIPFTRRHTTLWQSCTALSLNSDTLARVGPNREKVDLWMELCLHLVGAPAGTVLLCC
jgi:hypothetical protein